MGGTRMNSASVVIIRVKAKKGFERVIPTTKSPFVVIVLGKTRDYRTTWLACACSGILEPGPIIFHRDLIWYSPSLRWPKTREEGFDEGKNHQTVGPYLRLGDGDSKDTGHC